MLQQNFHNALHAQAAGRCLSRLLLRWPKGTECVLFLLFLCISAHTDGMVLGMSSVVIQPYSWSYALLKVDLSAYTCTLSAHHHHTLHDDCGLAAVSETLTSLLQCWLMPKSIIKQLHGTVFITMITNTT